jgi:hypothetical protein
MIGCGAAADAFFAAVAKLSVSGVSGAQAEQNFFLSLRGVDLEFVAAVMTELRLFDISNTTRWTDVPVLIQSYFSVAQAVV